MTQAIRFYLLFVALISAAGLRGAGSAVEEPCVLMSPEESLCYEWTYPHPSLCSVYIHCNTTCFASVALCPRVDGLFQFFSNASQACVPQNTTNCISSLPSAPTAIPATLPADYTFTWPSTSPRPGPLMAATFCATRSTDEPTETDVIDYDSLSFSGESGGFDLTADTFTPPVSGLYWLEYSVRMPPWSFATNVTLYGLPAVHPAVTEQPSLMRTTGGADDSNSRCELADLTAGVDKLTMSTQHQISSDPTGLHISFLGFHIPSISDPVVAFHAAKTGSAYAGDITWDTILVDTHGGFINNMHYTVPVSGIYVISVRCANYPQYMSYSTSMMYVLETYLTESRYLLTHWYSEGIDMHSMTVVKSMSAQYNLGVIVLYGRLYSDANYPTAIQGFLYSPTSSAQAVAWSVAVYIGDLTGPLDPLPFLNVVLNEGDGWLPDRQVFKTPLDGLYYISLCEMKAVSVVGEMELIKNGTELATLHVGGNVYNPTRSRSIILRLIVGDELWVRLPAGSGVKGEPGTVATGFNGIRLSS